MSIRNLDYLFQPGSVALIGASDRPHSVGAALLRNLLAGGFRGPIMLVNPRHERLSGLPVYRDVSLLPATPDLAVICTPPATVPALIAELGLRGTRAAIVITGGLSSEAAPGASSERARMLTAAKPHLVRILGPNCLGLLVPGLGLNASFAHIAALPGRVALVSQSGARVTAILDWATTRGIGFSKFVSLGEATDVDLGDILDYLASDEQTQSILLYVEAVTAARKFMSAARAAARNKPVLIVKAGRSGEGARAATSHTGALAGSDAVYDAAIRRAGMLRVNTTEDLFNAAETLARAQPLQGTRLAIMTNGGGPGVMATDALSEIGGDLATLSDSCVRTLDNVLPPNWSRANPIDIIGDAPAERYVQTMEALLVDRDVDAVLLIHAPTAIVPSDDIARALLPSVQRERRNVLGCWLGGEGVRQARELFSNAGVPTYATPEEAITAFQHMVQYRRNQQLLVQVPPARSAEFAQDRSRANAIVQRALAKGRSMLSEVEAKDVLSAYSIAVVPTRTVRSAAAAVDVATQLGFPVALKLLSRDVSHKSDVGGVVLDLADAGAVASAAGLIEQRLRELRPDASLQGFTVQPMVRRPRAQELIVGAATDAVFGPVILFGQGGTATEIMADRALALPPLNAVLARDLIGRTRVSRLLAGYRDRPPADIDAIVRTLVQVSQLVADLPSIAELDINPLLADETGVIALDARIRVTADDVAGVERFAIRPYPQDLAESVEWQGRTILLRPIRPEDAEQHYAFFRLLDPEDIHFRTFTQIRDLEASQLARLTQIDYDREMAFIATGKDPGTNVDTLGVARAVTDPDNDKAEFAIILRSDLKGRGLGRLLLGKLIAYCRARGTRELVGEALTHNDRMIALARAFHFEVTPSQSPGVVALRLPLQQTAAAT
jgi:acetyltransferase